ncbi:MAG: hypothetical protein ACREJM_15390 [Candidatus Saccharimonadales bacterium]
MSAAEEQAKLATPEYWDGIDIGDPAPFDVPYVFPAHTTAAEQRGAGIVLASCLDEVMGSDYVEQDLKTGEEFDPTESELGDGTVLVIDQESLAMWTYPQGHDRQWPEPGPVRDARHLGSDFVGLWRGRQPHSLGLPHFGSERVAFPDEYMTYTRLLHWAVLLTRRDEERKRLLATWALAAPAATPNGVSVPLSADSVIFRTAERLPMKVGQAVTMPDLVTPNYGVRHMERVRKLKIVHAATASYEPEEEPTRSGVFRRRPKAKAAEDEVFAPHPQPSTA